MAVTLAYLQPEDRMLRVCLGDRSIDEGAITIRYQDSKPVDRMCPADPLAGLDGKTGGSWLDTINLDTTQLAACLRLLYVPAHTATVAVPMNSPPRDDT